MGMRIREYEEVKTTYVEATCVCFSSPCSYPLAVMDKVKEMGDGIVVIDVPVHKTTKDGLLARGKRSAAAGNAHV